MKCPKDNTELKKVIYEADIEVDKCDECGGIWLNKDKLQKIEETQENAYTEELRVIPISVIQAFNSARDKVEAELKCPECGNKMTKKEYEYCKQIIIDVCLNCSGVWLDEGELQAIEVFFEDSNLDSQKLKKNFLSSLI